MTKEEKDWQDVLEAERKVDDAARELDKSIEMARMEQAQNHSQAPKRQYTPEEQKAGEEALEKLVMGTIKTGATALAVAGAGLVSIFKRDSAPIGKTWDWCKRNIWE